MYTHYITPCKRKELHGKGIINALQNNQAPIVLQQIIGHRKIILLITIVKCIPRQDLYPIQATLDKHPCWTLNNDHIHRQLKMNAIHIATLCPWQLHANIPNQVLGRHQMSMIYSHKKKTLYIYCKSLPRSFLHQTPKSKIIFYNC